MSHAFPFRLSDQDEAKLQRALSSIRVASPPPKQLPKTFCRTSWGERRPRRGRLASSVPCAGDTQPVRPPAVQVTPDGVVRDENRRFEATTVHRADFVPHPVQSRPRRYPIGLAHWPLASRQFFSRVVSGRGHRTHHRPNFCHHMARHSALRRLGQSTRARVGLQCP